MQLGVFPEGGIVWEDRFCEPFLWRARKHTLAECLVLYLLFHLILQKETAKLEEETRAQRG